MNKYMSSSLNSVVSLDLETSWAAKSLQEVLHQARYDAKFQQKQIQEREEKLLRLYETQQQKAIEKVKRGSAGSNTSVGSTGGGKVRQMFDERRQKAGIDRSYPLEPLKVLRVNGQVRGGSVDRIKNSTSTTVSKSTVQKTSQVRNGKTVLQRREQNYSVNNNRGRSLEGTFENDNLNKTFNKSQSELIELMNNNNLYDAIENEEMPPLTYDEPDEPCFTGKLANLGGRLPSEVAADKNGVESTRHALGKTFRKETKPVVKRTVRSVNSPQNSTSGSSVSSQPPRTAESPLSSPVRTASQTMHSANKTAPIKKGTPQPAQSTRTPCVKRPSATQSAKSPVARDDLNECRFCNRRFAADRLETHEAICGKTVKKKRKAYDATKHRMEGTELEQYARRGKTMSNRPSKQGAKKDWRRTHEDFVNAIRAAKQAQAYVAKGGKLSDLPPPPPSDNSDYVQCPHCGRKFNEAAAERHIPKCANYEFNKPKAGPPSKGKLAGKR